MNTTTTHQYLETEVLSMEDVDTVLLLLEEGLIRIDEDAYNMQTVIDADWDDLDIG